MDFISFEMLEELGITGDEDQAEVIETVINAIVEQVVTTIKEAIAELTENKAAQKPAEGLTSALSNIGKDLDLKDGESVEVRLKPEIFDQKVAVKTSVDANGKLQTETVIEQITFSVKPELGVREADGSTTRAEEFKNEYLNPNAQITFRLPIPSSVTSTHAKVVHIADDGSSTTNYYLIKNSEEGKYIEVTVSHFSTFELTFQNIVPSSNRGNSGGSSKKAAAPVATGAWVQNEIGWWYRNADGTWPAAQWVQLEWNGQMTWYYFNAEGYMHTGWLLDGGKWYFLHNVSDGTMGRMLTGWQQIEGKWYYFNPNVGGPQGSLLVNTVTPDGYTVDANGVWVQ